MLDRKSCARLLAVASLVFCLTGASAEEVLTNDGVIKLHQAGFSADLIIGKIRSSQTDFDTSVDALVALSEAGVPESVIAAMTGPAPSAPPAGEVTGPAATASGASQTVTVRQQASAAPNVAANYAGTPCRTPGIFYRQGGDLAEIDPTTYTQGKTGSGVLSSLTYGIASVKSKAIIQGTRSNFRVGAAAPEFYFCFEETESGLSYETTGATNPTEFLLVELDVNPKKRWRWFVAGKFNVWTGSRAGAPPKALRETSYEKLAGGVYRVTPRAILSPGEYGFYYAGSAPLASYGFAVAPTATGGGKIFAFGVD